MEDGKGRGRPVGLEGKGGERRGPEVGPAVVKTRAATPRALGQGRCLRSVIVKLVAGYKARDSLETPKAQAHPGPVKLNSLGGWGPGICNIFKAFQKVQGTAEVENNRLTLICTTTL